MNTPAPNARTQPLAATEHRTDLQGLRAVAVLLVALNHAGLRILGGGYVGVDVFFVLSGFLITGLLVSGAVKNGTVSLVGFYARRARRILPAAVLTLVVTDVVASQFLNVVRARTVITDSIPAAYFAANIHFANQGNNYFDRGQPPSPILHFWTLAVEEQFYLVWPAVLAIVLFGVWAVRRPKRRIIVGDRALFRLFLVVVVGGLASLVWSIHYTRVDPAPAYFSSFARAWELALGAALALASSKMRNLSPRLRTAMGWCGMAAIAAAAMLFSSSTPFPGFAALLPTIGAALVIAAGIRNPNLPFGASRALSVAPMRFIGDRSYTFYLWHWPFLIIALQYEGHELSLLTNLILLFAAFGLSVVTYALFENPIRRARWHERTTVALWPVSAATAMFVAGFLAQSLDDRALAMTSNEAPMTAAVDQPSRVPASDAGTRAASLSPDSALPAVVAAVQAARHNLPIPTNVNPPPTELLNPDYAYSLNRLPEHPGGCAADDGQTTSRICRLGVPSSRKVIVVLGDSHAEMWMPAIVAVASAKGFAVVPLVKSGCTPDKWRDPAYGSGECRDWYRWAMHKAKALAPNVMLIAGASSGALGDQAAAIVTAYTSSATAIKPFSKNVLILGDAAGVDRQPVDCLLARHASMRTCTTTWPDEHFYASDDIDARAANNGVRFIDTKGWFCFENQCPMVIGDTVVYRDTGHITSEYALKLISVFQHAFDKALGSR